MTMDGQHIPVVAGYAIILDFRGEGAKAEGVAENPLELTRSHAILDM